MFEKQKDYVQLKSDFILGQNPNQAIKAARDGFLDNEREIKSVIARLSSEKVRDYLLRPKRECIKYKVRTSDIN